MRGRPVKILITICFLALPFTASATAQAIRPAEFNIPFDFVIQGQSFPAGKYTVGRFDKSKPEILMMKNSAGRKMRIFLTQRVESGNYKDVALLVFNCYGDERILSQVWGARERSGRQILDDSSKAMRSSKPITMLVKGALVKSG